jgi:anti-sigma regulatory factor (Ser/Thr protein kinase)
VAGQWQMSYTMVGGSVVLARLHTRRQLTLLAWTGDIDDAVLIVSELVTNAVQHAQKHEELLGLRLAVLEDGSLLIDVSDPVSACPTSGAASEPAPNKEKGHGLWIVATLCTRLSWFLRHDGGKTLRAQLPG